jgi:metallo-beta-lactamase family protein
MAMTLYSLGAAEEVTGSKHVIEVNGRSYLLDCGAFQGKRAEADRKNREFGIDADRIESVILTHGHYDHCGLLPLLPERGYKGTIYTTPASRDIASLVMMDSAHIQARDAEYLTKQALKRGERFDWKPLYTEQDVVQATTQIVSVSYHRPLWIGENIQLEFYDAGHILGSAMAVLRCSQNGKETVVAYTGDLGRKGKPIIRDPETIPAPTYLILESTYGNRRHSSTEDALHQLAEIVQRTIRNRGKIVIPAFAIERTQELIYYFHILVDQKVIPEIPIYVDSPMATNATTIFQVHPECYDENVHEAFIKHHKNPFGFNALHFTNSVEESKALNDLEGPAVIIAADGMCEAGRIQHHLIHSIEDPDNTVLIVGYMAENTLGRRIQERQPEVKIHGQWFKLKARVTSIEAFSAHADYQESLEWLQSIDTSQLKTIFLVHGEKDAITTFKSYLKQKGYPNVEIIQYGKTYNLE